MHKERGPEHRKETSAEAIRMLVDRFNTSIVEKYASMPDVPTSYSTISDIPEFDECMENLDELRESGTISIIEYKVLQGMMNKLGDLTLREMIDQGEKARLAYEL